MNKKSSNPKTSLLTKYLNSIHNEINTKSIDYIKEYLPDVDTTIIKIDDDIKPVLLVLSSDILGNDRNTAINKAILFKLSILGIKSSQEGLFQIPNINLGNVLNNIPKIVNLLNTAMIEASSVIECMGTNIRKSEDDLILQYGMAMHIGAMNSLKAPVVREIGTLIGKTIFSEDKETYKEELLSLTKQLPNNKYKKRLKEYIELICKKETELRLTKHEQKKDITEPKTTIEEDVTEIEELEKLIAVHPIKFSDMDEM